MGFMHFYKRYCAKVEHFDKLEIPILKYILLRNKGNKNMKEIYFYVYVLFTFFTAVYLTLRHNSTHKFITFIIAYWILAGSVLNTEYFIIDIKRLPFDLQPSRIIFILFTIYLILVWIEKINHRRINIQNPKFEKYLYLFILFTIIVDVIHTSNILIIKDVIVNSTHILTFLVIYLVLKRTVDRKMINVFVKSLLIVCTFSSLIGIYQFLVDPLFFRLGSERVAFSGLLRSNGIFRAEYIQGYFLIPGIFLALFTVRQKLLKYTLIGLFLFAIIFTFHRTIWSITILLLTFYFIEVKRKKVWQIVTLGSILIGFIFLFSSIFLPEINDIKEFPFVKERLFADTVTGRIALYNFALNEIPDHWLFGIGSVKSNVYYWGILSAGGSKRVAFGEAGGIHNRYIGLAYLKGLPVAIMFILFLALSFYYFWRLSKIISIFFFIFLFEVTKYIIANLTNGIGLGSNLGLLLSIFLGIGVAAHQKKIDVSKLINESIFR